MEVGISGGLLSIADTVVPPQIVCRSFLYLEEYYGGGFSVYVFFFTFMGSRQFSSPSSLPPSLPSSLPCIHRHVGVVVVVKCIVSPQIGRFVVILVVFRTS